MLSRSLARSLAHPLSRNMVWESGSIPLPTINGQPSNVTVRDGQQATFTVTAIGATSYQWQRSDDGISFSNISGATANSYTFTTVRSTDNGDRFRCICTNTQGSVTSTSATLTVNLKDIIAKVGTSTSPTSTGTKAVTGIGFQPKVVMPFGVLTPSVGATTNATIGFGAGISALSNASVFTSSVHNTSTTITQRRHTEKVFTHVFNGSTGLEGGLSSLDTDGFTIDWSLVTFAGPAILNHICLGGADLEVSLTLQQMNGTNAPQSFAHGLSGAPTGLLLFSTTNWNAPTHTLADAYLSVGGWSSSGQFCAQIMSRNGLTTSSAARQLVNNSVMGWVYSGVANPSRRQLAVASVDSVNVNTTYPVTIDNGQIYFWMLAIRGAKCQTGTFDCNGSLSPLTINTPGITPRLFLPVFVPIGVDLINNVLIGNGLAIGACDGVNNVSCGIRDLSGATTTSAGRWQHSTTLAEYTIGTAEKRFEATAAFAGESVVITPTTNPDANYGQGCYFVVGA